jgi:histidinol-phosphate phosphatase family protein
MQQFFYTSKSALFLDRDGVINKRLLNKYIKNTQEFIFEENALKAIELLSKIFYKIVVVTNQQGIGKGLMSTQELNTVHNYMLNSVEQANGKLHLILHSPYLNEENHISRKPNIGMINFAKETFDDIDLQHSYMVGDMPSDMKLARNANLKAIYIENQYESCSDYDFRFKSLYQFSQQQFILSK